MKRTPPARRLNLTGQRFGRWTVLQDTGKTEGSNSVWLCQCDCGTIKEVRSGSLRSRVSPSTSCGCWRSDRLKKEPGKAAAHAMYINYQVGARKRQLVWELTEEQFMGLVQGDCVYCGQLPSRNAQRPGDNGAFYCNGIDRTNNDEGYTPTNCVACCQECNFFKRNTPYDQWVAWLKRVARHHA